MNLVALELLFSIGGFCFPEEVFRKFSLGDPIHFMFLASFFFI